jgi:hypothetical protein
MTNILISSAVTGAATLASAYALQKLYEKTDFYPPNPVFWFFIGVTAHAGLYVGNKILNKVTGGLPELQLPFSGMTQEQARAAGLAGFGETTQELDKMIDTYQKHIADLNKILAIGSATGKAAAQQKLAQEQKVLSELLTKRDDSLQD